MMFRTLLLSFYVTFDAASHAKLAEVAAGTKPHGLAFDPTGARIFVTDEVAGKIIVIDAKTRVVINEIVTGGAPNGIVWIKYHHLRKGRFLR
jgi:YVTN family beta-propeller protein